MTIGYDAKHIVCDYTGPGSYGRTLVNDIAEAATPDITFNLYTPEYGDEAAKAANPAAAEHQVRLPGSHHQPHNQGPMAGTRSGHRARA